MDVLIEHRSGGSVQTSVFCKQTHIDQYLDFQYHHAMAHKISVIRTLCSLARVKGERVREEHVLGL